MHKQKQFGFTLVEMIVVVVIIAALAGLTIEVMGNWRSRTAITEVKNDVTNAQSALKNYQNYNNSYPASVASVYNATPSVTLTYTLRADQSYCLNGVSKVDATVKWYADSRAGGGTRSGSCTP